MSEPEAECAPATEGEPRSGGRALLGLAVIWLCLYLVAEAQRISSPPEPLPEPPAAAVPADPRPDPPPALP